MITQKYPIDHGVPLSVKRHPRGSIRNFRHTIPAKYLDVYLRDGYIGLTNTLLPSGYTIGKTWQALRRCWTGYKIAFRETDTDKMKKYAKAIQHFTQVMGLRKTSFPHLGLSGESFKLYDKPPRPKGRTDRHNRSVILQKVDGKEDIVATDIFDDFLGQSKDIEDEAEIICLCDSDEEFLQCEKLIDDKEQFEREVIDRCTKAYGYEIDREENHSDKEMLVLLDTIPRTVWESRNTVRGFV